LLQFPRPSATAFTPFLRLCNFLCHTSQQRMTQTTLACSTEISNPGNFDSIRGLIGKMRPLVCVTGNCWSEDSLIPF
jgi:hypothetical protein